MADDFDMIRDVADLLTDLAEDKATNCVCDPQEIHGAFVSRVVPKISLLKYISRVTTYLGSSNVLLYAVILIDRALLKVALEPRNVHRVLLASYAVATKMLDDDFQDNRCVASIGGVPLLELNILEAEFLKLLDFDAYVSQEQFEDYDPLY
jgi:hypothetical protein